MRAFHFLTACIGLIVSAYGQVFVETIRLSSGPDPIPISFGISSVSCTPVVKDTITNHKGWQWAIEDGLLGGITSYINSQYSPTTDRTYRMKINDYNFIVNGNKKWKSWLDVSFYDKDRNEVFRIGSWEDLGGMPRTERGATLIKTLIHECISLFNAFLANDQSLNANELGEGFFMDQNGFLAKKPYFNAEVIIEEIKDGPKDTGMYSITFANDSTYDKSLGGLVFGYTNWTDVYFSTRNYQNTTAFSKVSKQGKDWAIFYHNDLPDHNSLSAGAVTRNIILGTLTGIVVLPYFHKYDGYVLIDFKNNEIHQATFQNLKTQFNRNKDLKREAKSVGYDEVKADLLEWWEKLMIAR